MTSDSRSKYVPWSPELGVRPNGNWDEPGKYGDWEGRATYLDNCTCDNPNCHAQIVRFVDDHEICVSQTISLRREAGILFDIYAQLSGRFNATYEAQYSMMFSAIHDAERRAEALKNYEDLSIVLPEMLKILIELKLLVEESGFISFYLEVSEDGVRGREKYRIQQCSLYVSLVDGVKPVSTPPFYPPDDDPAKQIEDDLPEGKGFFDNELLNNLFNGSFGSTGEVPPEG